MELTQDRTVQGKKEKQDADYVFYELTRSICPTCRRVIDGHILLRDNKVYMRKRCPEHGRFEGLIYSDAETYISSSRYNKPGTIPLQFSTEIEHGCPHDCGLCPDHQQHACLGIIEVNSACNMDCPLCFADAGAGYNLTLEEVEEILDRFVAAAAEFKRVLAPGSRIGISDLTRQGDLPPELHSLLAWIACIADALPVDEYHAFLEAVGLRVSTIEFHPEALRQLIHDIRGKLVGVELLVKLKQIDLPGADLTQAKTIARAATKSVEAGDLSYAILIAGKS